MTKTDPLVAIDPGHGASTPGKRSPDGSLHEYEFNRSVAAKLTACLSALSIPSMITVPDVLDPVLKWRAQQGRNAGCKILVSIHANAGGGTGIETYHRTGSERGERLARLVQGEVVAATGLRDRGLKTKIRVVTGMVTPGILTHGEELGMASILVELGFMDGPELPQLKTPAYRQKCAEAIARGLFKYIWGKEPNNTTGG